MIILCIIVFLLFCDSMYCRLMKKKSGRRIFAAVGVDKVESAPLPKQNIKQKAISFVMNGADSFTFLLFYFELLYFVFFTLNF